MAKCGYCHGTGYIELPFNDSLGDCMEKCDKCNGTGEVEMTEQEYIQTCTTEQLAEFLSRVFWARTFCELCDIHKTCKISNGCKYGNKPYRECWKEWLKQPHKV